MITNFILFLIINYLEISNAYFCIESKNYCSKCHPLLNQCLICEKEDILIPDLEGGCIGSKKCILGKNYCLKCDDEEKLCVECDNSYFIDENGACSYTDNCKISYRGECLECKDDYILVEKNKICKSLYSDDFKNCEKINTETGACKECKSGYYLNEGDKKCTKTEYCLESIFEICISCKDGFYLDKKENKCKEKTDIFMFCKQTIDGENCDKCNSGSYFDEEGVCVKSKFCQKSLNGKCIKCKPGYYLSVNNNNCIDTENCYIGDVDTGLCTECNMYFYLNYKNYKCISNLEDNEYKYCEKVLENTCIKCEYGYHLGKDNKCTFTRNCKESEFGKCLLCNENYYLGKDNYCSNIKHCIYSRFNDCLECENGYYYNILDKKCYKNEGEIKLENCKYSCSYPDKIRCCECKNNYYLNLNQSLCLNNSEKGAFYKCMSTDEKGENCLKCIEGYHLGSEDKLCTLNKYCKKSENENKCLECEENYCLDVKNSKCISNQFLEKENNKIYFACLRTNEEGTKCEKCISGYQVNQEGYCVNYNNCEIKEKEKCKKCKNMKNDRGYFYCANDVFGCVEGFFENCLRCENLFDLYTCSECEEGYEKNQYGACIKKN